MRKSKRVSKEINRSENFERLIFNASSDKNGEIVLVCCDIFVVVFYVKSIDIYPENIVKWLLKSRRTNLASSN